MAKNSVKSSDKANEIKSNKTRLGVAGLNINIKKTKQKKNIQSNGSASNLWHYCPGQTREKKY